MNRSPFLPVALVVIVLVSLSVGLTPTTRVRATPSELGCWYYKTDMPTARTALAAVELDDQIYIIGGQNGNERYSLAESYDPSGSSGGSWATLEPMPTARAWLVAAVANPSPGEPRIYAIGGSTQGTKYDTVEMYDPDTDSWSVQTPMNHPRHGAVAGVVDNKIYVIGGWRADATDYVEEYDPVADSWTDKAPLPNPVAFGGAALVNDKIYVVGGLDNTGVLSNTYEYDPAANTWTRKANMPLPISSTTVDATFRNRLAAAAVGDKIYVIGGSNFPDWWLDTVQVYDPASDTWGNMNWMPTQRGELAAAAVGDTIYVFGGKRSWDSEVVNHTEALDVDCDNRPPEVPSQPIPEPGWNNQAVDLDLNWTGGDSDEVVIGYPTYDVYFGEEWDKPVQTTPPLVSSAQISTTYEPRETLKPDTKYNWRIVARDSTGAVTSGERWGFRTGAGPIIDVEKTASPDFMAEPGGTVTFTVAVSNIGQESVTLNALADDVYGDIADPMNANIDSTTCSLSQTIVPTDVYTCAFKSDVSGSAGDIFSDTVTATAENAEGLAVRALDSAVVEIVSLTPRIQVEKTAEPDSVSETGGTVGYSVWVRNISFVPLALTELNDDVFGDVADPGNPLIDATTCSVPVSLDTGDIYECTFDAFISGNAGTEHTNTVTATATYDGSEILGSDSATVKFTDELPTIRVNKMADRTSLPEPGGDVRFTVIVVNTGVEDFIVASLEDDVYGDLDGQGGCELTETGPVVAPGQTFQCTFSGVVVGVAGDKHTNTVTAAVYDDEDNITHGSGSATVEVTVALNVYLPLVRNDPGP